jgi:DNA-binding transcriptional MerR regulator
MKYTVNQLSQLAGISVRTLHYYDEIGLLKPSVVGTNGYRYYEEVELIRLQQILFFRELEFPLEDIKRMLNRPGFSVVEALKDQKKLIRLKQSRLEKLIHAIDKTIKTMNANQKINDTEMYDVFKDTDVKQYQNEVKERWGNSDAYRESMKKVGKMTKKEMEKLKEDGKKHTQAIADSMDKGIEHPDVQKLIKQSHEGVNFFYECSHEMFRNLGNMYVEDPRFTAYYEKFRPGLAVFMRDAIAYYCDQHEKKI